MKLDGPAWIMARLLESIAEQRFFVCSNEELQANADANSAKQMGLIPVGGTDDMGDYHSALKGWYRYYPKIGYTAVNHRKRVRLVTRSSRGWLTERGVEFLDHELWKTEDCCERSPRDSELHCAIDPGLAIPGDM